jgi:hypothetical protein
MNENKKDYTHEVDHLAKKIKYLVTNGLGFCIYAFKTYTKPVLKVALLTTLTGGALFGGAYTYAWYIKESVLYAEKQSYSEYLKYAKERGYKVKSLYSLGFIRANTYGIGDYKDEKNHILYLDEEGHNFAQALIEQQDVMDILECSIPYDAFRILGLNGYECDHMGLIIASMRHPSLPTGWDAEYAFDHLPTKAAKI